MELADLLRDQYGASHIWTLTGRLRWVKRGADETVCAISEARYKRELQQEWRNRAGQSEWRTVEMVEPENE